jgi:tetratricopeptide (TPR) repeat protein
MFVNYSSIREEASKGNKAKYQQYIKDISGVLKRAYAFNDESKIQAIPFLTAFGNAEYACSTKDYDTYLVEYEKYLSHLSDLGAIEYLMPARRMINNGKGTPTKDQLKKCLPFNQIAYDKYKNAYVCTDFGLLMAKLGENEKARAYYEEAFQIFSTQGERGKSAIARFKKEMSELGL